MENMQNFVVISEKLKTFYTSWKCVWVTPCYAHGLLLVCSGVTLEVLWGSYSVPESKMESSECKASALTPGIVL